jgi:hypothetical protein
LLKSLAVARQYQHAIDESRRAIALYPDFAYR